MSRRLLTLAISALLVAALTGCQDDGSGFRAEEIPTKAEVQKKIDNVKNNKQIPEGAKPNILRGLEAELQRAK